MKLPDGKPHPLLSISLITAVTGLCTMAAMHLAGGMLWSAERSRQALGLAVSAAAGCAGFLVSVKLLRLEEFDLAFRWALEKVRRRRAA